MTVNKVYLNLGRLASSWTKHIIILDRLFKYIDLM